MKIQTGNYIFICRAERKTNEKIGKSKMIDKYKAEAYCSIKDETHIEVGTTDKLIFLSVFFFVFL